MRKLLILALIALPVLILLTLPASVVVPRFDPPAALGQYSGTIWSGSARWRQVGQVPMRLEWRWAGGRQWRWTAFDAGSRLEGRWSPGSVLSLEDVRGQLDVARLDLAHWLRFSRPEGFLAFDLDRAELAEGQAPRVEGRLIWEEAALVGTIEESLGRIELVFTPQDNELLAELRSLEPAAVSVRGQIRFDAERYAVDLWLRARPDRPDLAAQLGTLGERQTDGQVRLQLTGGLGW
ncbi:type II secretion system protein N [Wenzhouxiangella marina]|uniref:Type II secretion system protein N n=1 Tax=Wenzhouxiangella marina TaxID=1579979 RepID=A0A0K0XTJ7_9GAMM|nr:type II secretion system protein N [Wenzhouxiangella marina]AKS40946.1 hypothetical protein WM2015_564 [Wenzhouxiangella marina]MBB6087820.1 hypothetical protein [Wenzhouxiangella marina]